MPYSYDYRPVVAKGPLTPALDFGKKLKGLSEKDMDSKAKSQGWKKDPSYKGKGPPSEKEHKFTKDGLVILCTVKGDKVTSVSAYDGNSGFKNMHLIR